MKILNDLVFLNNKNKEIAKIYFFAIFYGQISFFDHFKYIKMFYFMYFGKFISLIYSVGIRESGLKNGELMKDCKGKELSVGDRVVFIRGKNSSASLDTGNITKFYKNCYGEDECSVGSQSHILSFRIMKLEK